MVHEYLGITKAEYIYPLLMVTWAFVAGMGLALIVSWMYGVLGRVLTSLYFWVIVGLVSVIFYAIDTFYQYPIWPL